MQSNGTQNGASTSSAHALEAAIQLAWTGVVSRNGHRRAALERIALVINARIVKERADVDAWIELENSRRCIVARSPFPCRRIREHGLVHIDIFDESDRLLALTVTDERTPRLVYAQTSLAGGAEFPAGMFDPPKLRSATFRDIAPLGARAVGAAT